MLISYINFGVTEVSQTGTTFINSLWVNTSMFCLVGWSSTLKPRSVKTKNDNIIL